MSKVAKKKKKRVLWKVVDENAEKTRQTKSQSYSLLSQYEVDLLNYAEDPKHGNYSDFVKRLIAEHKMRSEQPQSVMTYNPIPPETKNEVIETDTMGSFL